MSEHASFYTLKNLESGSYEQERLIKTLQWGARLAFMAELGSHFRGSIDDTSLPTIVDYFSQDVVMTPGLQLVPNRINREVGQVVDWRPWRDIKTAATLTSRLAIKNNLCTAWVLAKELKISNKRNELDTNFDTAFKIATFQPVYKNALPGSNANMFLEDARNALRLADIPPRQERNQLVATLKRYPTFFDFLVKDAFPRIDAAISST